MTEVYSQPRVAPLANIFGLNGGRSFDTMCNHEDGVPYDLSRLAMQAEVERKIEAEEPMVLIGSVVCRDFCQTMRVNLANLDPADVARRMKAGRLHLEFVCAPLCRWVLRLEGAGGLSPRCASGEFIPGALPFLLVPLTHRAPLAPAAGPLLSLCPCHAA